MPAPPAHPATDAIAAHAEGRLSGAEAARMDEHLASCSECYETFTETVRFALEEEEEEIAPNRAKILPFVRRPAFQLAAVLAIAVGLLLAFQQLWRPRGGTRGAPLVAELAQAMGTTRFIAPRLTGGFEHGRLVVLRSSGTTQGLDQQSPAVIAAVARIRERAEGDTSPEALSALAITYLVSGDVAKAVKALESATAQDPKNPRLQSDLAAAYLVRASRLDEPADIPKALDAAEKAIEIEGAPAEAWFNRALALEQLHLVDSARKAWNDYLERDSTSAWADEARKRLEDLPPAQQSTLEEDRARARAAIVEGEAAIDALADESPSILADYFLAELLPAWSDAYLAGLPNAAVLRTQARHLGEAIFRTTGDALPRDAALALAAPPSGPSRDPPRLQAQGYKALLEAERLYELQQPSCDTFRESHRLLESGGSPYASWSRARIVYGCSYQHEQSAAELSQIEAVAEERSFRRLLGRVHWSQALSHANQGELSTSLARYGLARDDFRALRDPENEANVLVRFAHVLEEAGESRSAWRERIRGLALLDRIRQPRQRQTLFTAVVLACLTQGLTRTARHTAEALVEAARRGSKPAYLSDALIWRSLIRSGLSMDEQAGADLAEARSSISQVQDARFAELLAAQADAADGRIFVAREPARAAAALTRALSYYEHAVQPWVPALRLDLARAQAALGLDDEAEAQLDAGILLLESQRLQLRDARLQAAFFDRGASLFDEMAAFQTEKRHDASRALSFVERGRARQLLDALHSPRAASRADARGVASNGARPREPQELQRGLPAGIALVYYECLPDRLLSWVVTREGIHFGGQALDREDLRREVAAYQAAMEGRAALSAVRQQTASLFDLLIRPLGPHLRGQRALVFIPDQTLQPVAFASLWDRQASRFLIEDHLIGFAPSGSVFLRATAATSAPSRNGRLTLLAVGNPRIDRERWGGLPGLSAAESEAGEVARLYEHSTLLTGREATKGRFLDSARSSGIVHYAGHAVPDDTLFLPRLLLAPEAASADSGVLDLRELDGTALPRTRLVVLAACRTAAGVVSRSEGALSLARPFLAAGVPNVIASLWDVDDALSRRFFVAFHRALLADGEPLSALRRVQLAFLREADPTLAHPAAWAAFRALGGLDARVLEQGLPPTRDQRL